MIAVRRVTQDNQGKKTAQCGWRQIADPKATSRLGRPIETHREGQTDTSGMDTQTR